MNKHCKHPGGIDVKRITFFSLIFIIILSGCSNKAYEEALQKGYDFLETGKYTEASEQFSMALDKKETEEAEKGLLVADAMFGGWDSYRAGIFHSAVEIAHNILTDDQNSKAVSLVIDDAKKLLEQAETMLELYNNIVEQMEKADHLKEDGQFEEALQIYEQIIKNDQEHFIIENLIEDANEKMDEVRANIQNNGSPKETESDKENNNGNNESDQRTDEQKNDKQKNEKNKQITSDEAEEIIRNALNMPDNIIVNYDHDEGNFYVIQVFEVIETNGGSHTATLGWYKVNKSTGEWTDAF